MCVPGSLIGVLQEVKVSSRSHNVAVTVHSWIVVLHIEAKRNHQFYPICSPLMHFDRCLGSKGLKRDSSSKNWSSWLKPHHLGWNFFVADQPAIHQRVALQQCRQCTMHGDKIPDQSLIHVDDFVVEFFMVKLKSQAKSTRHTGWEDVSSVRYRAEIELKFKLLLELQYYTWTSSY